MNFRLFEGILNPEELATMNNTFSKDGITLSAIQELRTSSESISTLNSENLALEHLEVNLFDNVRDSIQRSLGSSNHTKNMVHYEKIKEQKKPDAPIATSKFLFDFQILACVMRLMPKVALST